MFGIFRSMSVVRESPPANRLASSILHAATVSVRFVAATSLLLPRFASHFVLLFFPWRVVNSPVVTSGGCPRVRFLDNRRAVHQQRPFAQIMTKYVLAVLQSYQCYNLVGDEKDRGGHCCKPVGPAERPAQKNMCDRGCIQMMEVKDKGQDSLNQQICLGWIGQFDAGITYMYGAAGTTVRSSQSELQHC